MILVDTSVWVDFLKGTETREAKKLEELILCSEDLCICGVILAETLQGIREDDDYHRTLARFRSFLFLPMTRRTFENAAQMYRRLRRQGITIRKPVDCMIAAVALTHDLALLHHDRDFEPLAQYCGLKVVEIGEEK